MVHSTYTTKNGNAPMGIASTMHKMTPVKKKPVKNLILLPA